MLKLFLFILFMIPLFFDFWLIQSMMFIFCFLMFFINYDIDFVNFGYNMSVDLISFGFILLSFWIGSLMIMSSSNIKVNNNYVNEFIFMVVILMFFLFLSFSVNNFFMFYFFFESSLLPTLILIFGWGYQPERLNSGYYLLFYTLFASLPLLLSIFYYYTFNGSCMFMINNFSINSFFFYLGMIGAFLVKLPMFMFHFWLPKAHVEAPISGSMILAGVLLKLGGYGLLRVMFLVPINFLSYNFFWICVSLYGGLLISFVCLVQSDLKSLVAYSSVCHMSLVLMGIMTLFCWGSCSSYILMLGHGLCSSGLFCLSNIMYERMMSRSFFISKGMMSFIPSMSLMWFMFCACNMASPPSMNLLGELMVMNSLLTWSSFSIFFLMIISFLSACYSLYLFSYSQHGNYYSGFYSFSSGYVREYLLLILHWLPLNLFILKINFFVLY
uniref:NADH-ubiquinone oxidoreductase chain 4 n=1 Tax=Phymatostetha huangshanensis (nomen nudum) TaxID=2291524 RepID=A0A345UDH8_9HEMI|nr:NADH dehydrogenase subunit 4 [Phymatostetha huangshanensis (nomen nudum)]AXI98514.1 NADH dehydrogenase subunit 4 [Phymatostetha huangshanensis (nomen nudum)]